MGSSMSASKSSSPSVTASRRSWVAGRSAAPMPGSPTSGDQASGSEASRGVLLVGSSGGHLDHLVRLEPWWRDRDRHWVTFDLPDARSRLGGESVTWAHHPTTRNIPNLLRNLFLARKVIRRLRPALIVSTGAGVALPFFVVGRMQRIPTIYLEVYDRVESPTLTGRLCHPFASSFLVQWPSQQGFYPGSVCIGSVYP